MLLMLSPATTHSVKTFRNIMGKRINLKVEDVQDISGTKPKRINMVMIGEIARL